MVMPLIELLTRTLDFDGGKDLYLFPEWSNALVCAALDGKAQANRWIILMRTTIRMHYLIGST